MNVANGDFAESPRFFENLALEFTESETSYFTWAAKTAQQKP